MTSLAFGFTTASCQAVSGLSSLETQEGGAGGKHASSSSSSAPVCGDGTRDDGEACDDGNFADNDGCSSKCTFECSGDGTAFDPVTGDCLVGSIRWETWVEAEASCTALGGHLATPATLPRADAAELLAHDIAAYDAKKSRVIDAPFSVWLGASDRATEGQWEWVDGSPWTYTDKTPPWNATQPDDTGTTEDCLSFSLFFGGMNDLSCDQLAPFLCELPTYAHRCGDGLVTREEECDLPDGPANGCVDCKWQCGGTPAWIELRKRRCFFATASDVQATAITTCPVGSSVAVLDDSFSLAIIAARVPADQYWVGATNASGSWTWNNGAAVYPTTNTSAWAMGEPTGATGEDCLQVETGGLPGNMGPFGLRDEQCDAMHKAPALCAEPH